jgi:arylformamidase
MTIHDISIPLTGRTPVWPGDPAPAFHSVSSIAAGEVVNVQGMKISTHTGTHLDAPSHFIKDGNPIDAIPLETLVGPCHVADFTALKGGAEITAKDLEEAGIPEGTQRLILKTDNSRRMGEEGSAFFTDYVSLADSGCEWVVSRGILLVGIDYLSITPFAHPMSGHLTLLKANVVILESLDLSAVDQGGYDLLCLPLKTIGTDGAPARAILTR